MPPKKRARAESKTTAETGSRRRSGRISSSTGKKSLYFENDVDGSDDDVLQPHKAVKMDDEISAKAVKRRARDDESEDGFEYDDDDNGDEDDDDGGDGYDGGSADEIAPPPAKKRGRGRPPKQAPEPKTKTKTKTKAKTPTKGTTKAKAESGEAEPEEDEDEDDEDRRVTFIPLPKLRDAGGVEYEDTRLHKNTLLFLGELKANNKRSWLKMRDPEYRRSLKDWESFVETITEKITEADETIPELPLKDVIFRIYRDIRFSNDPTPYKPHYSAAWSRTGRKGPYACYYVHVEPNHCFVGGGLWHPDNEALAKLRASIDERPHRIRRVLTNPEFRRTFLLPDAKGNKNSEKAVLKAFADANQENALKTKPKGFHPDHRDIQLLKLRNYTVGTKIRDEDLLAEDAQDRIMVIIRAMVEFVTFLNSVVMPDPGQDSDSDGDDEDRDEGETEGSGSGSGTDGGAEDDVASNDVEE